MVEIINDRSLFAYVDVDTLMVQFWKVFYFLRCVRPSMIENVSRGCNTDSGLTFIYVRCRIEESGREDFPLPCALRLGINEYILNFTSRYMAHDRIV